MQTFGLWLPAANVRLTRVLQQTSYCLVFVLSFNNAIGSGGRWERVLRAYQSLQKVPSPAAALKLANIQY